MYCTEKLGGGGGFNAHFSLPKIIENSGFLIDPTSILEAKCVVWKLRHGDVRVKPKEI